ncbi:uncharacterized protein BDW47DRAFT_112121 [Aspergillus candidus]|uniref:Sld7 C-terminal domain-containing protein n=1 Tax=Aspergillus candidus TaxID=41067 RepID=A0A2I2F1G3_ASPCN|nr:hypothetical protein BDW47DRAFT_112121 [Aspergillus candidus]PLB34457.1 hypothetical protein BDW47DRAFT_112121 [Aspergillus candidus]
MNIWSGSLVLEGESQLQGLQLVERSASWQSDIARDSILRVRCFVNPALIPLYARAGPNLELHTSDDRTAQWLKSRLLGNLWLDEEDLNTLQTIQCPVGLLVHVDNATRAKASASGTTDLLVYGVLSSAATYERPPTPPVSSSPSLDAHISDRAGQELRIYAAPLSTSLIARAQALPSPPSPDGLTGHAQSSEFLPDLRSPSPKRKRVATLFDSVTEHHKRVRQRGGEAVSQLMAHSRPQSSHQSHTIQIKRESEEPSLPALHRVAAQRSRSLSVGASLNPGKQPLDPHGEPHPTRPGSSRGHTRDMSLRRVQSHQLRESTVLGERDASPMLRSPDGDLKPSTSKDAETIISENKNIITRTILTCMRLYGYNRPTARSGKSLSGAGSADLGIPPGGEDKDGRPRTMDGIASNTDEDEFKAMYHATYRASTFALRKYLREALPLEKGKAMTYIDEFLRLFCEDN